MKLAYLRFYEELNDYLPEDKQKSSFICCYEGEVTAAVLIGAVGVPLSDIDLILINDESVDPAHVVRNGDRMSCYPVFECFDIQGTTKVRQEPLRRPTFLAGPGLERLVAYLRLLGFDARSVAGSGSDEAARIAAAGRHIYLCRQEAATGGIARVHRVLAAKPRLQAAEVLARLHLHRLIAPLSRCLECNENLKRQGDPAACGHCGRTYRDGIHLRRMMRLIEYLSRKPQKIAQEKPMAADVGCQSV
jgi:uncharacterized protein with PIN domain